MVLYKHELYQLQNEWWFYQTGQLVSCDYDLFNPPTISLLNLTTNSKYHYIVLDTTTRTSERPDDIPRRPCMKKLCKHLYVKWHDNPVKIGKEIADRLEEV